MYIGELIKKYRLKHSISMQEFANASGLSKAYIGMLEKIYNPQNNKPISPSLPKMQSIAKAMGLTIDDLLPLLDDKQEVIINTNNKQLPTDTINFHSRVGVKIPILGEVVAGVPISAIENILGYEEITPEMAATGDFFCLKVKGASMEPKLFEGDLLVVRQQTDVDSNEIAVVLVNGDEATVKQIKKATSGITLIGYNVAVYPPRFYSNQEIQDLPVTIIGKVVELRRPF